MKSNIIKAPKDWPPQAKAVIAIGGYLKGALTETAIGEMLAPLTNKETEALAARLRELAEGKERSTVMLHIKNQTEYAVELCCGEKEYAFYPNETLSVDVMDEDCMYIDQVLEKVGGQTGRQSFGRTGAGPRG